ncbi:hypothetical protein [Vibrio sp. Evd11]|uniref:hypothetical protein n=1 Tax=Vibrio sp. Evd11 TaxID=1207404 RepID=UPI000EFC22E6|nr:hypothetical protein [Vibrio sp. Evd11]
MKGNTPDELTVVGKLRLKPYVNKPDQLGHEIKLLVQEALWPQIIANEYIWQIAQIKGKRFAEKILEGMYQ